MNPFRKALISLAVIIFIGAGCDQKSTGPDQFPPTTTIDDYAAWSAANNIIAYVHNRYVDSDDPDSNGIYIINPDGSGKNLLYQGWYICDLDWSPYGNYIIANSNERLVRISFPSGQADTLPVEGECWNPVWSPDGGFIAYSIRTSLRMGIYIINLESGFIKRAVNYCDFPNWLTGDSLLYVNQDRNFPVESICISDTLGYFGRVVMPPQNNIVTYYGMKINIRTKRIAFCGVQEGEPESIWAVDPGRSLARQMRSFALLSCFSPDGEQVVFTDTRKGYRRLYTYKWNGGEIRQLTY